VGLNGSDAEYPIMLKFLSLPAAEEINIVVSCCLARRFGIKCENVFGWTKRLLFSVLARWR
jgi:hypothetical protein